MNPAEESSLLPQHERLIRTVSAIAPEIAVARGYRSLTVRADATRLGFGDAQARVPALLVPIWTVHGEIGSYQLRPDTPRVKNNKAIKYETPRGSTMLLDVPPGSRPALGDPSIPLLITEGPRKADSASSVGFCAIDLIGVWNWRGTNGQGGKTALPDWECVALNGRTILLAFDSDVLTKHEVYNALTRLTAFLESRKAHVRIVRLPHGPGGTKMGLDDYLASGRNRDDVLALTSPDLPPAPPTTGDDPEDMLYRVVGDQICRRVKTPEGPVLAPLANFAAVINEEITLDDGAETTRQFVLTATQEGRSPVTVRVPAESFGAMGWVPTQLGARYVLTAGFGVKDHVRTAIQMLSPRVRERRVFAHTGWRQVGTNWVYLTTTGAFGCDEVEVDLGPNLHQYALPRVAEEPADAMRMSLAFLRVAPLGITLPLWGMVWRAPTAQVLPVDFALWLQGLTGAMKSTLAALALNHYGPAFDRLTLPGWTSTANQLERMLFVLKDALAVVDDYAPSASDARDLEIKSARVLRAQGNLSARHRLRHDLTERPGFPPRGAVVVTGEGHPPGASLLARTLVVEVDRAAVTVPALSALQAVRGRLCHAMAGYLTWLAPQMPGLGSSLRERFNAARARANEAADTHLRIPEALANVWVGVTLGLDFAQHVGALEASTRETIETDGWDALLALGRTQGQSVRDEDPAQRFVRTLDTVLLQRKAQVLASTASEPRDPDKGERFIETLGWQDPEFFYLLPEATYTFVARACREAGTFLPAEGRIRSALVKAGVAVADAGHTTSAARVGGKVRRVLKLSKEAVGKMLLPLSPPVTGSSVQGRECPQEEADTHTRQGMREKVSTRSSSFQGQTVTIGNSGDNESESEWVTTDPSAPDEADV
jgi:hypothetical protein